MSPLNSYLARRVSCYSYAQDPLHPVDTGWSSLFVLTAALAVRDKRMSIVNELLSAVRETFIRVLSYIHRLIASSI